MVDDIDGTEATDTLEFSWGADDYTIDLSEVNAEEFRELMAKYIGHATKKVAPVVLEPRKRAARGTSTPKPGKRSRDELSKIREWAGLNGHQVSPKGRIAEVVIAAYDSAMAEELDDAKAEAEIVAKVTKSE